MRVAAAVAAFGLVLAGVAAAPAPVAAADATGRVTLVLVSPATTAVRGLVGGQEMGIWVSVVEPRGQIGPDVFDTWPFSGILATVERTSGGPHQSISFELRATDANGNYYGGRRVASTWAGTWTVTRLTWYVDSVGFTSIDPRRDPGVTRTFTVMGSQVPTVSASRIPRVAAYHAPQWVKYTVRTSAGAPVAGLPVRLDYDTWCVWPQLSTPAHGHPVGRLTDKAGAVTVRLDSSWPERCVEIWSRPIWTTSPETAAVLVRLTPTRYEYYKRVSALPSAIAVRVNRSITVVGSVYPARGSVRLQRLVGRTWRTVASAPVRVSGRYTLRGLVPALGRTYFRVLALNGDPVAHSLAPTPSRTVVVTGTRR